METPEGRGTPASRPRRSGPSRPSAPAPPPAAPPPPRAPRDTPRGAAGERPATPGTGGHRTPTKKKENPPRLASRVPAAARVIPGGRAWPAGGGRRKEKKRKSPAALASRVPDAPLGVR